ncbi:zinc finger SWIM domain-containing protein 7-like [Lineus longissimus]|uniref:zinc finger SWIM domain-containing protein 7-like n=1 Tax=Lineus longissimus TaxID=88925 RepID=UPI002B4D5B6F
MNCSFMDGTVEQLFAEVKRTSEGKGCVTDEVMSALNFVFQASLLPALDLVDNKCVTHISSPNGRTVYQVIGSSGTPYTLCETVNFCCCPAYRYAVLKREDQMMCKHFLAMKLSEALGVCKQEEVTDKEMVSLLAQIG